MHQHVQELLPRYRIGTLHPDDALVEVRETTDASSDPYVHDPVRSPMLVVRCEKPFNAEPPPQLLGDHYITPTDLLFVRNHLPVSEPSSCLCGWTSSCHRAGEQVPEIDPVTWRLEVLGDGLKDGSVLRLSLQDLRTLFPRVEVTTVLQCAGNRRGDMSVHAKPTRGLAWGIGAMGNVQFAGARLRDVLEWAGLSDDAVGKSVRHVHFEGLDCDPATGTHYAASIPADRAMDTHADVLLAYEMNGEALTRLVPPA